MKRIAFIIFLATLAYSQGTFVGAGKGVGAGTVPAAAGAAPSFVQAKGCNGGVTTCTITMTMTAGNHLFAACGSSSAATLTIADTKSNVYNIVVGNTASGGTAFESWAADNIASGSTVITCTTTNSGGSVLGMAAEFHDALSTTALDKSVAGNNSATTSWTSGATAATTVANEIVFGVLASENTVTSCTAGSGYTVPTGGTSFAGFAGICLDYKIVSSTGAQTATMTTGAASSGVMFAATFQ